MDKQLRRLQLCHTGTFGSSGAEITKTDLEQIMDTFDGKAPISIGHYMAKDDWWPSWGNVINLYLEVKEDGTATLVGDIEIQDTLAEAIDNGLYPGWSVSIPRNAGTGKRYLHHLAFLGSTPPKIRDLKWVTAPGAVPENVITVGEEGFAFDDTFEFGESDFADFQGAQTLKVVEHDGKKEYVVEEKPEKGAEADQGTGEGQAGAVQDHSNDDNDFADSPVVKKAKAIFNQSVRDRIDKALEGKVLPGDKDKVLEQAHQFADSITDDWNFADTEEEPPLLSLFLSIVDAIGNKPGVQTGKMDFADSVKDGPKVDLAAITRKF